MTFEKYQFYYNEAVKIRQKPEIALAIENQTKLSQDAQSKAKKRYAIEDKLYKLYHSIPVEGVDDAIFGGEDLPEHERLMTVFALLESEHKNCSG